MRISIVARIKQGDILEALEQRGWNQRQGAEFLGLTQTVFSSLINLKWVPTEFSPELTVKLYELTGKMPEELFPEWARQRDFLDMPKITRRIFEVTPELLQQAGQVSFLPSPEAITSRQKAVDTINSLLRTLSPREEVIVRKTIMEEEDLEEVAKEYGTTAERIGGVRDRALRLLRSPERARHLRDALSQIR